ncbi:DNA-directed RNA polymerase, mitochondrial [Anguilla anguilla]|uniref:DNA-directed RNA polymerase, mitochondrial n=1 Tax=Anguilla anguilla TaxID=7936 RepID=UPI0015AA0D6E|nr:DNA-directed RNA polymerase, mitochondrial [Anguilla anguilla]
MSLLRLCAFPRCRTTRILFETNLRNTFYSDQCHACVRIRNDCHRRISESPWAAYRRNYSTVIPKKEDGKKRLWEQSHLLDVLEARIQQLQSDVFLDVKHSKVQVVKFSQAGKDVTPKKVPTGRKGGGPDPSPQKSGNPSRWFEKLNREKTSKAKRLLHHQQKNQQNPAKAKGGSGGLHLPGTSMKTISASKLSKPPAKTDPPRPGPPRKKDPNQELPKGRTASSSSSSSRHAASTSASSSRHASSSSPRHARSRPKDEEETLAELEELDRQLNEYTSAAGGGEQLAKDRDCSRYGDAQANVRCFLEACMYIGDVDRAQRCLLSHHHHLSRRKLLTVSTYNYMMRVWAKRGALNQIGRLFILVEEAGLKPDLGSYAAALECMGRVPNCSTRVISRCLQQLEEAGFSLEDLFRRCLFRQDERETVLKAVRMVEPDFQPAVRTEPKICTSPLVEEVYTKRDNVDYPKLDFSLAELQEKFSQQLAMEQADTVTIDSVEAMKPVTEQMAKMRALLEQQRSHWRSALLKGLKESKLHLSTSDQKSWRMNLYPYLCLLEDGEYVDIMLQGLSSLPPSGESLLILAKNLGHRIQNKFFIRQKSQSQVVDKLRHVYERYVQLLAKDTEKSNVFPRERWAELEAGLGSGPSLLSDDTQWPPFLAIQLGIHLVDLMVRELKVHSDVLNPAQERKLVSVLYHMYTFRSNHKVGFIKPHPILTQILTEAVETKLTFPSHVMPMLCPPVPWTSPRFGAYLLTGAKLMRSAHGAAQHQALLEGCGEPELHAVLDSLNQLGNCAWKVNRPLLDVIVSIFNGKGCERLDVPPPPSEAPEPPPPPRPGPAPPGDPAHSAAEGAALKREVAKARKKAAEMHSLRMDALYKLSIARHVRDRVFWFPHNMDFRGRTYPCPPYFNHLGNDVTRAVLLFAEGKALGPRGLDWLKVHLVNLTGLKKHSSLAGRLEYAESIMEDILDSADRPLTGRKWWMEVDEPWQALACCMEIAKASRSPDHTQYVSYFPVHQDGSCNGLQHYAALGRDVIGATSVNLMPCDVPQDVYSGVAQQVEEFRARDAQRGLKIAQVLRGHIKRKVVKQTVMTVVYGVTRYGGRLQIEKRLRDIDDFPQSRFCSYDNPTRTQPNGLSVLLNVVSPLSPCRRPDTVKQKNAFPPNFIHSLDSTHMMLTALYCYRAGLTFVSVHDCFWTHAVTVDTMNKICREQFVALHSQPIMKDLSTFLLRKYASGMPGTPRNKKFLEHRRLLQLLAKVPETGDFDLQKVKESTYFFS